MLNNTHEVSRCGGGETLENIHQVPGSHFRVVYITTCRSTLWPAEKCHKQQVFSYIMYAFAIVVTLPTLRSTMKEKTSLLLGICQLFGERLGVNNKMYKPTQKERPVHLKFHVNTLRCQQMFSGAGW